MQTRIPQRAGPGIALLLLIAAHAAGGCGLLIFPTVVAVPDPVHKVEVRDSASDAPITAAAVTYTTVPNSYYGVYISQSVGKYVEDVVGASPSPGRALPIDQVGVGRVRLNREWKPVWTQVYWPLPLHNGGSGEWVRTGPVCVIAARAPGYVSQAVEFVPTGNADDLIHAWERNPNRDSVRRNGAREFALERNGTLIFRLSKIGSSPNTDPP